MVRGNHWTASQRGDHLCPEWYTPAPCRTRDAGPSPSPSSSYMSHGGWFLQKHALIRTHTHLQAHRAVKQSLLQLYLSKRTTTSTCRFSVVLQHFTQNQLVGVFAKGVTEHGSRDQVHVTVGTLCLVCAGAIKVPLR